MTSPLVEALPFALLTVFPNGKIIFANNIAEELLGLSSRQLEGLSLCAWDGKPEELAALMARATKSGKMTLRMRSLYRPMATMIPVTLHLSPLEEEGKLLVIIEPLSEAERFGEEERRLEGARAAGMMAAMLAHEINNPLAGIRGAAQLMREDVPEESRGLAELICHEVDRIKAMLDEMAFLNEIPAVKEEINIHEVLRYVQAIASSGFARHVTFEEAFDPSLPLLLAHRDSLVQMFLNLVKNAAEATAAVKHARIRLRTACAIDYAKKALPTVRVSVEDNGPGIPPEVEARLFSPFTTTRGHGRGLGLTIAQRIATDTGGVVRFGGSESGRTVFVVEFCVRKL